MPRQAGLSDQWSGRRVPTRKQVRFCGRSRAWKNARLHDRRAGCVIRRADLLDVEIVRPLLHGAGSGLPLGLGGRLV